MDLVRNSSILGALKKLKTPTIQQTSKYPYIHRFTIRLLIGSNYYEFDSIAINGIN